jgi:hypothetical protein
MGQRVVGGASVLNHPVEEALDGIEVQVARLDAAAARTEEAERLRRLPRIAPSLAVAGRFQPMVTHQEGDSGQLHPQERGQFLLCEVRFLRIKRWQGAPLLAQIGEVLLDARGRYVRQEDEAATLDDPADAGDSLLDVLRRRAIGQEGGFPIGQMRAVRTFARLTVARLPPAPAAGAEEGARAVFLEGVGDAALPRLRLLDEFGQHQLSRRLVPTEPDVFAAHGAVPARGVSPVAVALLRQEGNDGLAVRTLEPDGGFALVGNALGVGGNGGCILFAKDAWHQGASFLHSAGAAPRCKSRRQPQPQD